MAVPARDIFNVNRASCPKSYVETNKKTGKTTSSSSTSEVNVGYVYEKAPKSVTSRWSGGWRPPTPWSHDGLKSSISGGFTARFENENVVRTSVMGQYSHPTTSDPGAVFGTFPSHLGSKAERDALNRLQDQNIDLGEFFGEFGSTVRMVAKAAGRITRDVKHFKRIHPKYWRALRKKGRPCFRCGVDKAASAWLEMNYGWVPLMRDVYGAIEELKRKERDIGLVMGVTGRARDVGQSSLSSTYSFIGGSYGLQRNIEINYQSRVKLWYRLRDSHLATLSTLGLINPALIAWNLTRLSFVVDWFAPIGPWLNGVTADAGWDFISGTRANKTTVTCRRATLSLPTGWDGPSTASVFLDGSRYSRTVYARSPVPGFYFKNPLSASHAITAIALLVQAFRK